MTLAFTIDIPWDMENTTQKAIAEKLGIPPPLLSAALGGTRRVSYGMARKIEDQHQIPVKVFREWMPSSIRRVLVKRFGRFRMNNKKKKLDTVRGADE